MALFSLFSGKPREQSTLVVHIDVGEGSCRGALLLTGVSPEMTYTSHAPERIVRGARAKSFAATLVSLKDLLGEVSKFMASEGENGRRFHIEKIYAILSAPYYLSHTALIKYREKDGFVVTPELVSSLVANYRRGSDKELEAHTEAEIGETPVTVAERIVDMKVNGYHTASPYGKKAATLDLGVFKTEIASEVIGKLEQEFKKHFRAPVFFEPLSLAAYVALRNHVHFDQDFLFIVVGNEVTEVSLVRGFVLLETVSFPFGKHSLIRHVSRELNMTEDAASASLSLYGTKEVRDDKNEKLETSLQSGAKKWFPFFEKALVALSDESSVPQSVYLITDVGMDGIFKMFLETDSFSGQSLVPSGFSVRPIDSELAKTLMRFGKDASCDPILCLEGLFAVSTKLPLQSAS